MSVVVKDACVVVDDEDYILDYAHVDFSKAGEARFNIVNTNARPMVNIVYKTSNDRIVVKGPSTLMPGYVASCTLEWESCEDGDYFIVIQGKLR